MGTRSQTVIYDANGKGIVCLMGQYDGYPEGWGKDLAEFLAPISMLNGLGLDDVNVANGMECLAGQIIAKFKTKPGGIYIHSYDTDADYVDYVYTVSLTSNNEIWMEILTPDEAQRKIFAGAPCDFAKWLEEKEKADEDAE